MDNELTALGIIFTEFYYWLTVVIMFLIHVGFCMYEVGASRHKNHMHTLMKNTMLIPLVTITFFFFGWWIYFAFPNGPGITGGLETALPGQSPGASSWARTWVERRLGGLYRRRHSRLGAYQRRLLGGIPAVLLDRRIHRLGLGDRAHQVHGLSGSSPSASAPCGGSSTPPGAGTRQAGWCRSSATTTPMRPASFTPSPAAMRSVSCSSWVHASASSPPTVRRAISVRAIPGW